MNLFNIYFNKFLNNKIDILINFFKYISFLFDKFKYSI